MYKSRYGLGIVFLLGAGAIVYGFIAIATAIAQSGPPGPGWREILPRQSIGERWREGKPNSRTPQPPRPKQPKPK